MIELSERIKFDFKQQPCERTSFELNGSDRSVYLNKIEFLYHVEKYVLTFTIDVYLNERIYAMPFPVNLIIQFGRMMTQTNTHTRHDQTNRNFINE